MTHDESRLFQENDYAYDEYYDCYICPNDKILTYSTTNRKGYLKYKSNPEECKLSYSIYLCTNSKNHTKVITRHIWAKAIEDDVRNTSPKKF